ncbi:MAG: hypothetical protein ACRD0J_13120 [Acidimicrobiales bacterium]
MARAAKTGGGRTKKRGQTPLAYYATLVVIVVLGLVTVSWSRYQVHHKPAPVPPTLSDHWYAAFAFDICGSIKPNPPQNPNLKTAGLRTYGGGLIHVAPLTKADTGHNATLGRFVSLYPGMQLTSTSVQYPGKKLWHNGDKCGTKAGKVQVKVWSSLADQHGHILKGNPDKLLIENGQLITVAFVPPGTFIPKPPSRTNLANPSATEKHATTTAKPKGSTSTTAKPKGSTSTTAKGSTSTTAKGSTSTTTTAKGTTTTAKAKGSTSTTSHP